MFIGFRVYRVQGSGFRCKKLRVSGAPANRKAALERKSFKK